MRVLIACEFSGAVRRAFRDAGHDAWSCDLLPAEDSSPYHIQADALSVISSNHIPGVKAANENWDLMIAHPPCTYLANSGAKHLYNGMTKGGGPNRDRFLNMLEGAHFFWELLNAPIDRICIENPIMHGYAKTYVGEQQTQTIQPWQFGHGETKATCLWLKNLPKLKPTQIVEGREARVHKAPPSDDRWMERSRTLPGIAGAMAEQWGAA